jgi:hypothetical protein
MVRGGVVFGLAFGLLGGPIFGLLASVFRVSDVLLIGLLAALVFALPAGLVFGLLNALAGGLEPRVYVTRPAPGKAIQRSKRNALVSGLVYCLIVALVFALVIWLVVWLATGLLGGRVTGKIFVPADLVAIKWFGPIEVKIAVGLLAGLLVGLPAALVMGLVVGLQQGGGAYLRHWVTRWMLVADGVVPRDYVAFLEYARRIILLRRRGGGYEFIHRLVLEHFTLLTHPSHAELEALTALNDAEALERNPRPSRRRFER